MYEDIDLDDFFSEKDCIDPYKHFSDLEINENNPEVKTGEPDLCNPSSFENVCSILFNIGQRAGIEQYGGNDRNWLFIECDGGIYTVVDKLIFNVFHCSYCGESIYGCDEFLEHRCSVLNEITN